jgi:hypothetical protein
MRKSHLRAALASVAALLISFAAIGVAGALDWVDRPFSGFLVLGNGVVASVGLPSWPATRDGEIFQRAVTGVEGAPIERPEELRAWVGASGEGAALRYQLASHGQVIEREIAVRRFRREDVALLFGAYLLNGLLLGTVGLALLARSGRDRGTRSAVPFLVCAALWGLSGMDLYGAGILFRAHVLCEALLFATALHMALEFPTRLFGRHITRRLVQAGYGGSLLLAAVYELVLFDAAAYVRVHLAATTLGGLALLLVVLGLLVRYVRCPAASWRAPLGVLAAGACLALVLPVALTLPEAATGGSAPQNVVGWTVFLFPVAIGYAVRRGPATPEWPGPGGS